MKVVGKLVYFFSVIPHPSVTKFTTYTLLNRHQQPVLQSHDFSVQHRSYSIFESYREFLLSTPKAMTSGLGLPTFTSEPPEPGGFEKRQDGKIDYWLDDDDDDEQDSAAPSLYWRSKVCSNSDVTYVARD